MSRFFIYCTAGVSLVILAACTTTGTPLQPSSVALAPGTRAALPSRVVDARLHGDGHPYLGGSWISPDAESMSALLYVSDFDRQVVNIYDYRSSNGRLVGQLAQRPSSPEGLCVDRSGNVYVTSYQKGSKPSPEIKEYAHGGLQPLETLSLQGVQPSSCAIDSATGTVAVALYDYTNSTGGLDLIIGGLHHGHQVLLSDTNGLQGMLWDAYDPSGNLFIVGITGSTPGLDELPAGHRQFVHLSGLAFNDADQGIQWDGKHIAVGDTNGSGNDIIVSEITVNGSTVKVVRRVTYTDPDCSFGAFTVEMAILRNTLAGANFYCDTTVDFWGYDKGGIPERIWTGKNLKFADGQAISTL